MGTPGPRARRREYTQRTVIDSLLCAQRANKCEMSEIIFAGGNAKGRCSETAAPHASGLQ